MHILNVPAEIRSNIFRFLLDPAANRTVDEDDYTHYHFRKSLDLFLVNKQVAAEAREVFYNLNSFVVISTPWSEAQTHVSLEGHVPILASGDVAAKFKPWTASAVIGSPNFDYSDEDLKKFVVHIDDIPTFVQAWMYADLTHPDLNPNLTLALDLRDPLVKEFDEPRVSKAVQQRIFLPFGRVKRLAGFQITGRPMPYESVIKQLREDMSKPHESPESCLRTATYWKDQGNQSLKDGDYEEALSRYRKAWLAIHIVVNGRTRHIHGDLYYNRELVEEPYKVMLYLKMQKYDDAAFWGMRTIKMIRQAIGLPGEEAAAQPEDEAIPQFVAAVDMGKVYFRTAMAWKAMDEKGEARKLLKVAQVYLPNDKKVQEEVAACALRIG